MGMRGMKQCNQDPNRKGRMRSKVQLYLCSSSGVAQQKPCGENEESRRAGCTEYAAQYMSLLGPPRTGHFWVAGSPFLANFTPQRCCLRVDGLR